jgi:hypothetical protein
MIYGRHWILQYHFHLFAQVLQGTVQTEHGTDAIPVRNGMPGQYQVIVLKQLSGDFL